MDKDKIINNWHLITDALGDYNFHDSVIKRFDLNGETLTIVVNTCYEWNYSSCYDITFRFNDIIRISTDWEIGDDYTYEIEIEYDKNFKHLIHFTLSSAHFHIEAFKISVISVEKADSFQRRMILLDNPNARGRDECGKTIRRGPQAIR